MSRQIYIHNGNVYDSISDYYRAKYPGIDGVEISDDFKTLRFWYDKGDDRYNETHHYHDPEWCKAQYEAIVEVMEGD